MKRVYYLIIFLIVILTLNVSASGGTLKQNSIIECNGVYYGNHGNPLHWHRAKLNKGMWVSDGEEVDIPSCYIKPINTFEEVKFSKCVDGDTAKLMIKNVEKTVRFLAIDTPEIAKADKEAEPYANQALDYTCNRLKQAKKIVLEYDSNSDKEDKYGRVLAFVFVDDELLEEKLIENGYAKVAYLYGDYNHVDDLKKVEEQAKEKEIGIWGNSLPDEKSEENNEESFIDIVISIIKILYNFFIKYLIKY